MGCRKKSHHLGELSHVLLEVRDRLDVVARRAEGLHARLHSSNAIYHTFRQCNLLHMILTFYESIGVGIFIWVVNFIVLCNNLAEIRQHSHVLLEVCARLYVVARRAQCLHARLRVRACASVQRARERESERERERERKRERDGGREKE